MKHLLVSSSRDFFAAVEEAGLTFTQVKCLHLTRRRRGAASAQRAVRHARPVRPRRSAAPSTALVQRGEVKRTEDPRDRRSKLLTVSARGRRTLERFVAIRFAGVKRFVEELTDEERAGARRRAGPDRKETRLSD